MKKIKCPDCKGTGHKPKNINRDYDTPDYDPCYIFITCPKCFGKGKIPKSTVKYKDNKLCLLKENRS